ncbi:LuxR C-terminal-related transcriptional regulator [uncultured Senegalimassilia sp.]|uniref:LuxR C-terminal-related transcriptional regulator n=1 Tax=uncultured Senegalimassilia sp. TaxID=1714350 RepID=UPI0026DF7C06|nr:LuxR C-terminal-related transcriptional regulator [uncultured Senegalimassilia sp.]
MIAAQERAAACWAAPVKTHLARVMAKLDAHDRAQLVVRAYESGLVKPGLA